LTPKARASIFTHRRFSDLLTPQLPNKVASMRILIHYLIAVVILTVYGGQV
jgi:hypothetical protein